MQLKHYQERVIREVRSFQRSLFDFVPDEMNDYEKSVALFLEEGDSKAKDWQDTLRQVLATYRA